MAKQPKTLTKPLLRNLNDHSGGGFMLFTFDGEGLPQVSSNFDSHIQALALQHYIQNWAKAVEAATIEGMANDIIGEPEDGEEI